MASFTAQILSQSVLEESAAIAIVSPRPARIRDASTENHLTRVSTALTKVPLTFKNEAASLAQLDNYMRTTPVFAGKARLLSLPAELRMKVWEHVMNLEYAHPSSVSGESPACYRCAPSSSTAFTPLPGLLLANRQTSLESQGLLRKYTISFCGINCFLIHCRPETLSRMKWSLVAAVTIALLQDTLRDGIDDGVKLMRDRTKDYCRQVLGHFSGGITWKRTEQNGLLVLSRQDRLGPECCDQSGQAVPAGTYCISKEYWIKCCDKHYWTKRSDG